MMKIATTSQAKLYFKTKRQLVAADKTDFTDVAALVVAASDIDLINKVDQTKFGIPIFVITSDSNQLSGQLMKKIYHILDPNNHYDHALYNHEIEAAAAQYEKRHCHHFLVL